MPSVAEACSRDPDCLNRDLPWAEKEKTLACQNCVARWEWQQNHPPTRETTNPDVSPPSSQDFPKTRGGKHIPDQW